MSDDLATAILEELKAIRQALEDAPQDGLLTAAQVAQRFGVARDWVYGNADLLGAIRLPSPTGQKPRLRFDPATVLEALKDQEPAPEPRPKVELLPVGGKK
jgi:hypothetical protein